MSSREPLEVLSETLKEALMCVWESASIVDDFKDPPTQQPALLDNM
jgi:hypothetical protein